jgi:hypothetical protein
MRLARRFRVRTLVDGGLMGNMRDAAGAHLTLRANPHTMAKAGVYAQSLGPARPSA